jgi:RNA polymerase sigma-70 factor (ECF subfamily)
MQLFHGFDRSYLDRLRDRDPEIEAHFVVYFSELIAIKLRGLRSRSLAEDVRQETFFRIFRALRTGVVIREPARLGAFVVAVCNNVLKEQFRSQSHSPRFFSEEIDTLADQRADTEAQVLNAERQRILRAMIAKLPDIKSRLLHAMLVEGLGRREMCERLGVPRAYLRVLLHRATSSLRSNLLDGRPTRPLPLVAASATRRRRGRRGLARGGSQKCLPSQETADDRSMRTCT